MLSPKNKRNFLKVLPFGLITFLSTIIFALLEKGIMGNSPIYPSTGNPYVFNLVLPGTLSFIFGILMGTFEVFYLNKWFQKSSFLKKIIFKTAIYMFVITFSIMFISIMGHSYAMGVSPLDEKVMVYANNFFSNFAFWSVEIYLAATVSICIFYTEVSDNLGQGVLLNLFTGKYHQPVEEERIFMFIDMKSSTTIAEKLGHIRYFKLLKEYYADLSDPIVQHGGEIYQYVGDEIVISWKYAKNATNNNCLNCFFEMKAFLKKQSKKYEAAFGVVPTFKAGLHLGEVTTGEIGVVKREIIFSGDVLNTTARIQGLCNKYETDLLASEKLIKALDLSNEFQPGELEKVELRGRNEKVKLFTIEKKRKQD